MSIREQFRNGITADQSNLLRSASDTATGASALSDTLKLYNEAQGFMVSASGNIKFKFPNQFTARDGNTVTWAVQPGVIYTFRLGQIFATGTTVAASAILLGYNPY